MEGVSGLWKCDRTVMDLRAGRSDRALEGVLSCDRCTKTSRAGEG